MTNEFYRALAFDYAKEHGWGDVSDRIMQEIRTELETEIPKLYGITFAKYEKMTVEQKIDLFEEHRRKQKRQRN